MNDRHAAVFRTANVSVAERRPGILQVSLQLLRIDKHFILNRPNLLILFFPDGSLLILIHQHNLIINGQAVN